MDGAVVGVDDERAIVPIRIFVSADWQRQGELFEHGVVEYVEFVFGKRTENGAWFGDVLAAPKSVQEYLKNPNIQKAIQKGLKYLGESQWCLRREA